MEIRKVTLTIAIVITVILVLGVGFYFYRNTTSISDVNTQKTLTVAGSGSAGFALKNWATEYEKLDKRIKFDFLSSADAAIGMAGVKENTLSIGVASRKAKPEEEFPGMVLTPFTKDAVVFIINTSVAGVRNLNAEQLVDIYTGKITNWSEVGGADELVVVVDREESESAKKLFREFYLKDKKVSVGSIEVHSEKDVLEAVVSAPGSIGYLSYGRVRISGTRVGVLSIDGIDVDKVESGAYKLIRIYYVVTRQDSLPEVKDFVSFLQNEGQDLAEGFSYFSL